MKSARQARSRFERASFVRHLAICLAALSAWAFRDQVRAGNDALWIIGAIVVANLTFTIVADRPAWTRLSLVASPAFSLAGWAALVHLTGGASSPFVAGLGLEIVLSSWIGSVRGTLLVAAGAVAALWGQQATLGMDGAVRLLAIQSAFLAATAGVMLLLGRHWGRMQDESASRHAELMERLLGLESEMEIVRRAGPAGENVARLGHALKNAVHSLRGFASLIVVQDGAPADEALEGLRAAIDRLEEISRITLGERRVASAEAMVGGDETRRVIEEMIEQVSVCYPRIGWRTSIAEPMPAVRADRTLLREALVDIAKNAAEAMHGTGEIAVETVSAAGRLEIRIRDQGAGFTEDDLRKTFAPGFTTKPGGSGFGLFLTRRFVEAFGGRVTVSTASEGGAVFSVGLLPWSGGRP